MKRFTFTAVLLSLLIFSGCNTVTPTVETKKVTPDSKISKVDNSIPDGYKLVKLDKLHLSLVVPKNWKLYKEELYGEWHYFIGTVKDFPGARIDKAEIWDTFLNNTFNIHGVYLRTAYGNAKNFDIELQAKGSRHPTLFDKDLSNKKLTIRSVLRKSEHYGYYQFYAVGSKKKYKRGVILETASQVYTDENDEMKFNDSADKKEIDTIINSIHPYKDF